MKRIVFVLITLLAAMEVSAQAVRLRATGEGKVSVTRGKLRSVIDLKRDIAGCPFVNASRLRDVGCAAPPAEFHLVDAAIKNNHIYIVVQTEAMNNCNVCGRCGASEAFALIWLKLDLRLRLLEKKAVPIDYCFNDISLVEGEIISNEETQDETLILKFKNDIITIAFEKKLFNENPDATAYEFSQLEYNRKTPERGFVIKTEKRDKSSIKEQ